MKPKYSFSLLIVALMIHASQHFKVSDDLAAANRQERSVSTLPEGFTYVDEIDPRIISNLRYLTSQNFIGKPINGYYTNRAIMTIPAAKALKEVQQQLSKDGYRIVIYDSYRPQKAVDQFVEWGKDQSDTKQKGKYYPYVDKADLFDQGYLAKKSGHSRGSTVDLSIIKQSEKLKPVQMQLRKFQNGLLYFFLDDNSEDYGSSFDYLGQASHPQSQLLLPKYIKNRKYLISKMQKQGFQVLDTEWWHFTLKNQPYPNTYFDFDVR